MRNRKSVNQIMNIVDSIGEVILQLTQGCYNIYAFRVATNKTGFMNIVSRKCVRYSQSAPQQIKRCISSRFMVERVNGININRQFV